ncbi:MAG: hypothetical protein ACRC62_27300 [Microcoleus sp.]
MRRYYTIDFCLARSVATYPTTHTCPNSLSTINSQSRASSRRSHYNYQLSIDRERGRSHYNSQSIASEDARTTILNRSTINRSRARTLALQFSTINYQLSTDLKRAKTVIVFTGSIQWLH